jgi:hypothetical protein
MKLFVCLSGEIERQHRIINKLQRILYQGRFPNILARWDEYAKRIRLMLNTAVVELHGMSPLYFFFERPTVNHASQRPRTRALRPWTQRTWNFFVVPNSLAGGTG